MWWKTIWSKIYFEGRADRTSDGWDVECERKQGVKDNSEVFDLNKWGNDNAIYGDEKDCKMTVDEGLYMEQNKSSIFGLCWSTETNGMIHKLFTIYPWQIQILAEPLENGYNLICHGVS